MRDNISNTQDRGSWAIYCPSEQGWWNDLDGWGGLNAARTFTDEAVGADTAAGGPHLPQEDAVYVWVGTDHDSDPCERQRTGDDETGNEEREMLDKSKEFPTDWTEWRAEWSEWLAEFSVRYGVRRRRSSDGPSPFEGKNFLADEILGVWSLGPVGTDGSLVRAVELSEVTFTLGRETRRAVGVTIDASGPEGTAVLAWSWDELDGILAPLAQGHRTD